MNGKAINVLAVLALMAGFLGAAAPATAAPPGPEYRPAPVGDDIREMPASAANVREPARAVEDMDAEAAADAAVSSVGSCTLDTKSFLTLDNAAGSYFFTTFNLLAESGNSQIWVQADPSWPEGDPRDTPVVTCDQATYLMGEFDNTMYPTETSFFRVPDNHDGSTSLLEALGYVPPGYYGDAQGRQVVLVANVRDANFYDPTYPLYIAGFYSDTLESYFDRNTMTIDAYDWENRTGPDSARPYLYEGVFAHEYQHLLHSDQDGDEVNWVNEGLSDFAQYLVGYGHSDSHVADTAALPENSLVVWGDQGDLEILSDYGHAYMFMLYLYENYGAQAVAELFLNPANDISGVDAALSAVGASDSFADVYHSYAPGLYMKGTFDSLPDFQVDVGFAGQRNPEAFETPGAPPWGTDYILFWQVESINNLVFNGVQFNPTQWTSDGDTLYGGSGDLVDNFLIADVDLSGVAGAMLTFDTMFDIEFSWDYGFVQVSTDGGQTWDSLSNGDTCSDLAGGAHPKVAANVPGFTGVSGFGCNDPYVEPSYPDAEWINTSFDLSMYDGQEILVAFRYVTDYAYNEPGWYIDNVDIAGVVSSDGSSTSGFKSLNETLEISNDYTLQLIGERTRRGGQSKYTVMTILSGGYMQDWAPIADMFSNYDQVVMLVTYDAPEGVTSYAAYSYDVIRGQQTRGRR